MAKTDTPIRIAALAARVHTVGEARAVLGKTAETLHDGYGRLGELPETADLRASAQELLDNANLYAQKVYAGLSPDPATLGALVDAQTALKVGGCLAMALRSLRRIEEAAAVEYWDFFAALEEVLIAAGTAVGTGVQKITNAALSGGWALIRAAWPTVIFVVVVAGGLLYWRYFRRRGAA